MEAAIHRYTVVQLFFIFLAESLENACNEVKLQPTTCLFTKNLHFYDVIVIWRTPLSVKQLSAAVFK